MNEKELIETYRKELKDCENIFREYAENNLAKQPLHKYVSARKAEIIRLLLEN